VRPFALHSIFGPRALDKCQASALCSTPSITLWRRRRKRATRQRASHGAGRHEVLAGHAATCG
jgi:hypothetical protein